MAVKDVLKRAAWALDIALLPAAAVFAPFAYALARLGEWAPTSRSVLDRAGVSLVRQHYYQPGVRRADLYRRLSEERELPALDLNEEGQLRLLAEFDYADELRAFPTDEVSDLRYFYRNSFFGSGDAELLYDMIRHFKPARILEVGSGFSTRIAQAAIHENRRSDDGYVCDHVCIEPYEMPWLEQLGVGVIRERVELIGPELILSLQANDIFFIDSSHVIRPQGDVLHEYLYLLPKIAPGVFVHIHDIFTPRDYLEEWVLNSRLMWNEQYLLEAFLSFNTNFEVVLAANWLSHRHRDALKVAAPVLHDDASREPGSFWIRRVGAVQAVKRPRRPGLG